MTQQPDDIEAVLGLAELLDESDKVVPGGYQLIFRLPRLAQEVGRLGLCTFPAGVYVYSGSAMGGIRQRVLRHLRSSKCRHWHIDYVLEATEVFAVRYVRSTEPMECALHREAMALPGAVEPVVGFGSSDCRCRSHLVCLPRPVRIPWLTQGAAW